MQNSNAFNLLLDADGMMDTRMGTLLTLSDEVPSFLPLDAYRRRTLDDWTALTGGKITTEAFTARYACRDISVLQRSVMSGMVPVLINYIESLKERLFRGVDITSIAVDINTWPYVLPGPIADSFQNCLRTILPVYVHVNVVHLSPQELTPELLGNHYSGWVTYDLHPWLALHHESLLANPINEVAAIIPKLFQQEPGAFESGEDDIFVGMDKHGLLELVMEDFLHIEHLPVTDFCFVVPGTYRLPEEEDPGDEELTPRRQGLRA